MNEHTHDTLTDSAAEKPRGIDWNELVWGLSLVTVGLFLTLRQLDIFDPVGFWRYTPSVMVILGLLGMARSTSVKEREGSWCLLISGIYLWINFFEVWGLYWGTSWPVVLVLIGLAKLIDPTDAKERRSSVWFLGIGAFFLIVHGEVFDLDYGDAWPLFIIGAGGVITWRALFHDRDASEGGAR